MNLFLDVIRQGDKYLQSWPKQRVLNCLFIDSKVTYYTRLSIAVMPAFLALVLFLAVIYPNFFSWPMLMTYLFFILGLPVQGLYWLGKRSQMLLPRKLLSWYGEIQSKLQGSRYTQGVSVQPPRYMDLALLLSHAFKFGGDKFLQQNELI